MTFGSLLSYLKFLQPLILFQYFGVGNCYAMRKASEAVGLVLAGSVFISPSTSLSFGTVKRFVAYTIESIEDTGPKDLRILRGSSGKD